VAALHHRIDIDQAPLLHLHVAEDRGQQRWLVHALAHHIVIDHTSLELIVEEAQLLDQSRADELPATVPSRELFGQALLGMGQDEHQAFFEQMLSDVVEPTTPFGLLDVQGDGRRLHRAHRLLPRDLAAELRLAARRQGVSAASLMHLAWALVVAHASGRDDVVFGTVLSGRMQAGEQARRMMGMFINTLPLRVSLEGLDVRAALRQTHQALARLVRHEHASLSLAQRCSGEIGRAHV
jgi:hypothetical protein